MNFKLFKTTRMVIQESAMTMKKAKVGILRDWLKDRAKGFGIVSGATADLSHPLRMSILHPHQEP